MDHHDEQLELTPPDHFVCPLTLEIMEYPLKDPVSRRSFEKKAILQWLDESGMCPITRRPLEPEELVLNKQLRKEIKQWKKEHGASDSSDGDNLSSRSSSNHSQAPKKKVNDRLMDIRSRVLAKQSERLSLTSSEETTKKLSQDTAESLGCLMVQSFKHGGNSSSSKSFKERSANSNKQLSSKLSGILSSVVDDMFGGEELVDDDDGLDEEMAAFFKGKAEI